MIPAPVLRLSVSIEADPIEDPGPEIEEAIAQATRSAAGRAAHALSNALGVQHQATPQSPQVHGDGSLTHSHEIAVTHPPRHPLARTPAPRIRPRSATLSGRHAEPGMTDEQIGEEFDRAITESLGRGR